MEDLRKTRLTGTILAQKIMAHKLRSIEIREETDSWNVISQVHICLSTNLLSTDKVVKANKHTTHYQYSAPFTKTLWLKVVISLNRKCYGLYKTLY